MSSINPFSGYVAQGAQVERTQAAGKTQQLRRAQQVTKNVAVRDDEMEHTVENTDAVTGVHDDSEPREQGQRRGQHEKRDEGEDDAPHIDVTA